MKKILKILLVIAVAIFAGLFIATKIMSKPVPESTHGSGVELADKMLSALNKPAWDSLNYLKWTFRDNHHYLWDKQNHIANVSWGDNTVILNTKEVQGIVTSGGQSVAGEKAKKLVQTAWSYWCNDSFWMFAPFKVKDPGTTLSQVNVDGATYGLKVEYTSGGVTPGDTYVWYLDDQYMPIAYDMYTQILPVQGLNVSWNGWKEIGGAKLSTDHGSKVFSMKMTDVAGGQTLESISAQKSDFMWK